MTETGENTPAFFPVAPPDYTALTLANLRDCLTDRQIPVQLGSRLHAQRQMRSLHSYIDGLVVAREPLLYARQIPLERFFPELSHLKTPRQVPADRVVIRSVWIGPSNSINPLHRDNINPFAAIENYYVQCDGAKEFLLLAPHFSDLAMEYSVGGNTPHHLNIDLRHLAGHADPRVAQLTPIAIKVAAPSGIFVPSGWWHQVHGISAGVSLSHFCFQSRFADCIARVNFTVRNIEMYDRDGSRLAITRIEASDIAKFGGYDVARAATQHLSGIERQMLTECLESDVDPRLLI